MSVNVSSKKTRVAVRVLTFSALLIALTIVFQRIGSITVTPWLRFSLAPLTIMIAGMYGGPIVGGMVGGVSDFLGMLIAGQGAFHPGIMLTAVLRGVLPGLIVILLRGKVNPLSSLLSCLSELVICSLLLQSFWLSQLYGIPYRVQLIQRLATSPLAATVYFLLLLLLVPSLNRVVPTSLSSARGRARASNTMKMNEGA
ncbi:MAG: folate family ECF transporter S component [Fastidiosipilaceae bacterium]|jgi:ECF transporter S component (folate family)